MAQLEVILSSAPAARITAANTARPPPSPDSKPMVFLRGVMIGCYRAHRVVDAKRPELLTATAHPIPTGVIVITVCGEVDLSTAPRVQDVLLAHLRPAPAALIVDLTDVGFFGAAGLTTLITAQQAATAAGVGFGVIADSRPVLLPVTLTGLGSTLNIHADLAQALLHLGLGPAE